MSDTNPPVLMMCCTMSSMGEFRTAHGEASLDDKLAAIKQAGFVGVLNRTPPITRELLDRHGLRYCAHADIATMERARPELEKVKAEGVDRVNVQLGDHDTPIPFAVDLARHAMATADELGVNAAVELHRDTATETPEKMFAIADGFEKAAGKLLPITWDFSHFAVIKSLAPPFYDRLMEREDLVVHSDHIHFRPFNGHHAQIRAIDHDGALTHEFKDYLEFVDGLLATWLAHSGPGRELWGCPETLGGGYGLVGDPDMFIQARAIRDEVQSIWDQHLASWSPPA